jgi:hypothetical protein
VKKLELIKGAFDLLLSESDHLSEAGHAKLQALVGEQVEEDNPLAPVPQTDGRWHEYALAAVGAFGNITQGVGGALEEHVASTVDYVTKVADGLLAAAKERVS